jgi:hypothetical protein
MPANEAYAPKPGDRVQFFGALSPEAQARAWTVTEVTERLISYVPADEPHDGGPYVIDPAQARNMHMLPADRED